MTILKMRKLRALIVKLFASMTLRTVQVSEYNLDIIPVLGYNIRI